MLHPTKAAGTIGLCASEVQHHDSTHTGHQMTPQL